MYTIDGGDQFQSKSQVIGIAQGHLIGILDTTNAPVEQVLNDLSRVVAELRLSGLRCSQVMQALSRVNKQSLCDLLPLHRIAKLDCESLKRWCFVFDCAECYCRTVDKLMLIDADM